MKSFIHDHRLYLVSDSGAVTDEGGMPSEMPEGVNLRDPKPVMALDPETNEITTADLYMDGGYAWHAYKGKLCRNADSNHNAPVISGFSLETSIMVIDTYFRTQVQCLADHLRTLSEDDEAFVPTGNLIVGLTKAFDKFRQIAKNKTGIDL